MFDFRAIVRTLAEHEIEFAIVGGLAGVMQGAPIHTQDLDVILSDLDWMELDGTPVRVISLPRLIELKKKLSRPKDQLALLQLQATLEERQKQNT